MRATPYSEFQVGDQLAGGAKITEAHLQRAAELFDDYNPIHMDAGVAANSVHRRRILHGPCLVGLMMATVGNAVAGTGIGELTLTFNFKAPACIGDSLTWEWTVTEKIDKPKYRGGIVVFEAVCCNQDGATVMTALTKVLVANAPMYPRC